MCHIKTSINKNFIILYLPINFECGVNSKPFTFYKPVALNWVASFAFFGGILNQWRKLGTNLLDDSLKNLEQIKISDHSAKITPRALSQCD